MFCLLHLLLQIAPHSICIRAKWGRCIINETMWSSFHFSLSTARFHFNQSASVFLMLTKATNSRWTFDKTVQGNICFHAPDDSICLVKLSHPCQLPPSSLHSQSIWSASPISLKSAKPAREDVAAGDSAPQTPCVSAIIGRSDRLYQKPSVQLSSSGILIFGKHCSHFAKLQG